MVIVHSGFLEYSISIRIASFTWISYGREKSSEKNGRLGEPGEKYSQMAVLSHISSTPYCDTCLVIFHPIAHYTFYLRRRWCKSQNHLWNFSTLINCMTRHLLVSRGFSVHLNGLFLGIVLNKLQVVRRYDSKSVSRSVIENVDLAG